MTFLGGLIDNVGGKATVVGITSYTAVPGLDTCCLIKKPTAFTNVAKYADWIKNIIEMVDHVDPGLGLIWYRDRSQIMWPI